tara:strand:- start:6791 stop:7714 length:924 start_codon:yes stop_codon:yes gene_type:complete
MEDKPLVSYCLFTYNQEAYVRESLEAALAQSYSPLEVVISDDCSTDGTAAVIREVLAAYSGEHRIILNVNQQNMGIGGHISKVLMELTSGEYYVLVGGDDISGPDHVKLAIAAIQAHSNIYAVDFAASIIDEKGGIIQANNSPEQVLSYCLEDFTGIKKNLSTFAPGRIIHSDVVRKFPRIAGSCPTEDSVFVLRSLMLGGLRREPINLIQYRRAEYSVSSASNIKKLSLEGIINQYNTDIDSAADSGLIDELETQKMKRRIVFEHFKRKTLTQHDGGRFMYTLVRVKVRVFKWLYQLGLFIGPLRG